MFVVGFIFCGLVKNFEVYQNLCGWAKNFVVSSNCFTFCCWRKTLQLTTKRLLVTTDTDYTFMSFAC